MAPAASVSEPEVRRCARCHAPAAVCERDWQHTALGIRTGSSTRDFCCQECGHRFTLEPMMQVWVPVGFAVLLCWTCVMPVIFGGMAGLKYWPYHANQVVPGAALPEIRYRTDEPNRRCAGCGGVARCQSITRNTSRGLPTGTEYEYACAGCGQEFSLESTGSLAFNVFGALFCFLLGFGCMPLGIVLWLMSLGLLAMSGWRLMAGVRNPLLAEAIASHPQEPRH